MAMVDCSVKRTCEVTLVMGEEEAMWLRTLLLFVKGAHPCRNRLMDALTADGIGTHRDNDEISGEINWPLPVAF